jgi:hypothetical protein
MDEQALNDAYNLFTRQGYNGTIDQFKKLISSNSQALNDSYQIFRAEGYNGDINNYSTLVGVKKKASSTVSSPDSKVGMEDLQNGFDFSPTIFEAPAVLTPKKQKEYIEEQKGKPAPVVIETPTPETTPKGWETYQAPSKEDEQGLGLNILSSLNKGIYKNLIGTPIKALGTFIEGTTALLPRQIRSETGKGVISESLINFGNYFNEAIDEISPQDKEFKDSLTDQFAQAFGQVASTILTAGVGGAGNVASKGAAMLAKPLGAKAAALAATKEAGKQITGPAGISSALTMGQSEYERAKEAGATDEQAFEAFYKNAVTGSVLETIPVMQFMKRFNTATNGGVLNYIKTKGVAGLTGGVEELTTEVLQTIYGNKTAQEIYNENQNIFEGVGNAGGIGFGVGFLLNAMGANAKVLRRDGKNSEADILENQIEGIQSRIENGPPPVYKINGLKIESPEIVNDMIERMDAPDLFKLNIEIDNDPELKTKLQEKIVTSSIMEQVREANPELNEPSLKAIVELEKQLTLLEGNKTQTGKDKAAAIRTQIKDIQENQLQEEAVAETVVAEAPDVAQKRVDRIAEIETTLAPENTIVIEDADKIKLQTELETLKAEQDAIQEQATDESVLRTEQPEMGLQQVGEGNVQPEGVTAGTEEVITPEETQEVGGGISITSDKLQDRTEDVYSLGDSFADVTKGKEGWSVGYIESKNKGDGTKLINKIIEDAKRENVQSISLQTGNGSESFFSKFGFEKTIEDNGYFYMEWTNPTQEVSSKTQPTPDVTTEDSVLEKNKKRNLRFEELIDIYSERELNNEEKAELDKIQSDRLNEQRELVLNASQGRDEFYNEVSDSILLNEEVGSEMPNGYGAVIVDSYYDSTLGNYNTIAEVKKPNGDVFFVKVNSNEEIEIGKTYGKKPKENVSEEVAGGVREETIVVEEEQFVPLTSADIEFDIRFSRDEASNVEEGEREGDNGRSYTYIAEVETPVSDVDGAEIGYLVKMVDDDKNLTFEARDEYGNNLSKNEEGFDTLGEARQALLDNHNKQKKKEFDREAKAKAKEKAKADAKAAAKEAKAKEKAKAKEPVVSETIDDLLDLDVADQDNLDKIFNALDNADKSIGKILKKGANEAMLAIPLGTVQVVIKAIKALVKGGMLLRDAIKKVSADNNISQESVKDILNIAPIQGEFNSLMEKVDKLIARQKARGIQDGKITSNIDTFIRKQDEYLNANDAQKKIIEREARGKMGAAPKRSVSIGRVLGALKDITNISREEKLKVISQIRQLSKDAAKDLAKEIRAMASSGKITANQAANIVARFGKVNMLSEISVSKFVDYMAKVFANAEYASKLSQAQKLKKDISKLSKNKDKNANLRDLAQQFVKIDPTMVDDIDAYNDMASKIKEAIKGSTIRGAKVKFADTVNIENATEYIDKTIEAQDEMMRQEKASEIQDLMGVDVSDLSYEDMMQMLDSKEPITKYNEGIIRSTMQKMFDLYSALINTTLSTGKDPFTDEDVEITKNQKNLIKRFMGMDLTLLTPKQALQVVDALANFFENRSTAKMEAILAEYTGNDNAKQLVKDGVVAKPLKKYWSEKIGRFLGEQTTNLNILFERMFKGFNRGGRVEDAMGVTMLKNNKSMAERQANNIVEKYIAEFYKKKANDEAFNSEYNSTERGLAAFMMRNVIGTEKEMQAEFKRRRRLIEQSIEVLSQGNEKEKAKAELYQKVYDKILKDSDSIQDVKDKTDTTNLEGIDFWNKEWADKYEQLSDVSLNIYNKILDKDINYTPDKFVNLSTETGNVELSNDKSAFHYNNGNIYDKETGVLMTAVKPNDLPTNPKNGETSMYIDLSFDKNNSNSMYDALIDIGTAAPIRQIEGFLNSPNFKKIIPKAEDAKILKERIQLYVGNIRNKNPYSTDELSSMVRGLNRIASIGVGQALGGVLQPVKQMIPVAMNTLINAGNLDMGAIFDSSKNAFINRSGFAISNRGIESQAQVESLNKLIDEASKTKGEKLIKNIEKLNNWWLEKFLVKPDLFIARASWMTYYEQSLKKQGIDTKGIDYNTHEVNQEAAEYAQRMVDRQQNVSDSDLAGKMFSNKESSNQLFVKMLMPFASFRMNQSARLGSDLAVLTDKTATSEDKKIAIKSLSGFAVEMATFKMIAAGSAFLLGSAAKWLMDDEEDEKEKEKRLNNIIKGQVTSSFNDVVSPLPILDKAFQTGGNFLTENMLGIPKESVFSIYSVPKQEYIQSLGLFGIAADRASQLYDITKLSTTGKYVDDYGKEKTISEEKQKALGYLIGPAVLTNIGLAPVEVNSIVRNSIKSAKSKTSGDGALTRNALERWASSIDLSKMSKVAEFIKGKKEELSGKGDLAEKREFRKELEKDLLGKYEDKAQMRGVDPELYKKNFGAESDWVKKGYAAEEILEDKFNTILNKKKNLIKIEELKKQK